MRLGCGCFAPTANNPECTRRTGVLFKWGSKKRSYAPKGAMGLYSPIPIPSPIPASGALACALPTGRCGEGENPKTSMRWRAKPAGADSLLDDIYLGELGLAGNKSKRNGLDDGQHDRGGLQCVLQ